MKQRREKVLQNAKDRKVGKANAPVALQASIGANRASKDTQNITMIDNAITGDDNTDNAITGDDNTNNAIIGHDNIDNVTTGGDNTDDTTTSDGNMDNSIKGEVSTVDVSLPPCYSGKAKHPSQIKNILKTYNCNCRTFNR